MHEMAVQRLVEVLHCGEGDRQGPLIKREVTYEALDRRRGRRRDVGKAQRTMLRPLDPTNRDGCVQVERHPVGAAQQGVLDLSVEITELAPGEPPALDLWQRA